MHTGVNASPSLGVCIDGCIDACADLFTGVQTCVGACVSAWVLDVRTVAAGSLATPHPHERNTATNKPHAPPLPQTVRLAYIPHSMKNTAYKAESSDARAKILELSQCIRVLRPIRWSHSVSCRAGRGCSEHTARVLKPLPISSDQLHAILQTRACRSQAIML